MKSNYYLDFENKFRGDREKILDLLHIYEPLIDTAIASIPSPSLLDIGCGRGECLQKYRHKFCDSFGIESDQSMVKICRDNGLNILEGDALDRLSEIENDSISVITIFHMIEHLEHKKLLELINECFRVLSDDGILIMETPSIDNLIVSTKSFYLDHTHINPINPDAICFHIEKAGFSNVTHFFLNGGPLQEASPLKITRILNGVAQDLCIIATKKGSKFKYLFIDNTKWQEHLNHALTTLQAAIEFDLKLESSINNLSSSYEIKSLNEEILILREEIFLLKARLKYFLFFHEKMKNIFRPIFNLLKLIKQLILIVPNKILNVLINNYYFRNFLISRKGLKLVNFFLFRFISSSSNFYAIKIHNKLKKIIENNEKLINYNQKLFFHYKYSNKSKKYMRLFSRSK